MLSEDQITRFQQIYKAHFGRDISRDEAYDKGIKLLRLIEIIYKPMTESDYNKLQERRRETGDLPV